WYKRRDSSQLKVPAGDIESAFDNNQILGKTYNIIHDKQLLSISTTVIHAIINKSMVIQCQDYQLDQWCTEKKIGNECAELTKSIDDVEKSGKPVMQALLDQCPLIQKCLKSFVDHMIDVVVKRLDNNLQQDYIQSKIDYKDSVIKKKICTTCHTEHHFKKRKCQQCKITLIDKAITSRPPPNPGSIHATISLGNTFQNIPQCHPSEKRLVIIGEPYTLNPSSTENITTILRDLKERCLTSTNNDGIPRKWMSVTADACPYCLTWKIFNETFVCYDCNARYSSYSDLSLHYHNGHPESMINKNRFHYAEFNSLIFRPGLGHIEMNACKSFMNFIWNIFGGELSSCLNFKSEEAKKYALSCADRHKTFQILATAFCLMPKELLQFFEQNDTFSTSGNSRQGEDLDFVLENFNKKIKHMIPYGLLDNETWIRVNRNFDELHKAS
ncbi:unnamed protein product, partial [Didymodactylos carnosus]